MQKPFLDHLSDTLHEIDSAGLYKRERQIVSPQAGRIDVELDGKRHNRVVNLCANNYLGLANNPRLSAAAIGAIDTQGFGMASVRFICGTQDQHRKPWLAWTSRRPCRWMCRSIAHCRPPM